MSRLLSFLWDVRTRFLLSMKLMVKDRVTVGVFLGSVLAFLMICGSLNFSAEAQSKVPVGLVNLDRSNHTDFAGNTELSNCLVDRVQASESFQVTCGSLEQLKEKMKQGELSAIFVIEEGYEDNISIGRTKKLITVYCAKDNRMASMLSDIFAGEMMEDICANKSYLAYHTLDFTEYTELTKEEYLKQVLMTGSLEEFLFRFDLELKDPRVVTVSSEQLSNAALYRQIIAGMFAMLLSFVLLFSCTYVCMEKEQGMLRRRRLTLVKPLSQFIGTFASILTVTFTLDIIFVGCVCYYAKVPQHFFRLLCLSVCYTMVMAAFFYFLSRITKGIVSFQVVGAIFILVIGLFGFCTMVDGILFQNIINIVKKTPNGWFIQKFIDIIIEK